MSATTDVTPDTRPDLVSEFLADAMSSALPQPDAWSSLLLRDAVRERATDIHIDPHRDGARIRFRVDGAILDATHVPREIAQQLINQMKVLARLDPVISSSPLESRWQEQLDDQSIDIRLTAIACHGGEKLHARLLDRDDTDLSFESLGLNGEGREIVQKWQAAPDGLLLVTGPTGAGKTTMSHAILRHFVQSRSIVLTIEDPVEYELNGATQIPVDELSGIGFAEGISAMLRLDPDCMLVGELRDGESAAAAMKAAATGHAVISTLHARNSVGAITTLRQWGIKNSPIAGSLSIVINQRLVARLCESCKRHRETSHTEREWFETYGFSAPSVLSHASGCEACNGSGARGRLGVYEVWKLTDDDKCRIADHASARELTQAMEDRNHSFLASSLREQLCAGEINLSAFE